MSTHSLTPNARFLGWAAAVAVLVLAALLIPARPTTQTAAGQVPPGGAPQRPLPRLPAAGLTGYEVLTYGMDVVAGNTGVMERACSAGKQPLGGGFYFPGAAIVADPGNIHVMESSPRVTATGTTGWRVVAWNRTQSTQRMEVYVICGNASP